jgi:pimeloyl-ACP methyl ester carboxylesterase
VSRLTIAVVAALASLCAWAVPAEAQLRFRACGDSGDRCARLSVPLDRTGAVPGRVSLLVKRRDAKRATRPPLVLLAGGPGQSATAAFAGPSLGAVDTALRSRDLITVDQRGSGRSGLLRCRALERSNILRAAQAAARCAESLGARRAFYTSRDTADDLEAVRVALGVPKLALYGVSYGTRTATAFALRHPGSVDRLILDSVVETDGPDALYGSTFAAIPRVLGALCGSACGQITSDPARDVNRLVQRFARGPLKGRVFSPRGRSRSERFGRLGLFFVMLAGDFDAGLRAALPGAVRAGLGGDAAPLLRLKRRAFEIEGGALPPREFSTALYVATTCEEANLPWTRAAPFSVRREQAAAAAAARPDSSFFPFDRASALESDIVDICSRWPEAPAEPVPGPGPLPDVPALLIEGGDDLRTPVEAARTVAAQLPQSQLVVVPGVGHSTLGVDPTGCSARAFARFVNGGQPATRCARARRPPLRSTPPRSLAKVEPIPGARGLRSRAAAAVLQTLDDIADDANTRLVALPFSARRVRGGGLRGGRYELGLRAGVLRLRGVRFVSNLAIGGSLRRFTARNQRGTLRVRGPRGARGVLRVRGSRIVGRLGGRRIVLRLARGAAAQSAGVRSPLAGPSPIRRPPRPPALPRR